MQKYFSEDYVIPSQKLNEDKKKCLCRKLKCFLGEDQKERSSPKIEVLSKSLFSRNLVLCSTGICMSFSSNHPALQVRRQGGGHCPPVFIFAPRFLFLPPDLFLVLPRYFFFLKVSIALTVKIKVILTVPSPIRTSIVFD